MAQQLLQPDPHNVFRINLAPHANQSLQFTFQPASDGPVVHRPFYLKLLNTDFFSEDRDIHWPAQLHQACFS
jgi:hypothetical protein